MERRGVVDIAVIDVKTRREVKPGFSVGIALVVARARAMEAVRAIVVTKESFAMVRVTSRACGDEDAGPVIAEATQRLVGVRGGDASGPERTEGERQRSAVDSASKERDAARQS